LWVSRGTFVEETTFLKNNNMFFLIVLELPANFFQNIGGNISTRLSKLLFTCPGEESEQKIFFLGKVKFYSFS